MIILLSGTSLQNSKGPLVSEWALYQTNFRLSFFDLSGPTAALVWPEPKSIAAKVGVKIHESRVYMTLVRGARSFEAAASAA